MLLNEETRHTEKEVLPPLVGGIEGGGNRLCDIRTEMPLLFSVFHPHLTSPIKGEEFINIGFVKQIKA